jgi:hypothetical protein
MPSLSSHPIPTSSLERPLQERRSTHLPVAVEEAVVAEAQEAEDKTPKNITIIYKNCKI